MSSNKTVGLSTRMIHSGRNPSNQLGAVNPPIHRASTIVLNRAEDLYKDGVRTYGIGGMQVHDELKNALCALEDANHCLITESGLLACTLPIFALVGAGEHILLPDNVYSPTRRYCDRSLKRAGGSVSYYDPTIGEGIADLIQDNTRLIMIESPGSLTFELPDIRAIVAAAKARGVATALDNCWGSGVYLRPLDLGVDISILATTKYAGGHSDTLSGALLLNDANLANKLAEASADLGLCTSPEDASIVLRGLRTMTTRLKVHEKAGLEIAEWLQTRPEVSQVLHPALPDNPYHKLWKRDFTGSAGLFTFELKPSSKQDVLNFLNSFELFGLGFSYGGYESLVMNCDPQLVYRDKNNLKFDGPLIRLSIGLEDVEDLKADLEKAFATLPQ
ncbi:cystathionine beta-lyase [Hirschia maritima]|uniref:cystathionine beta-lyase n=1 Tax=Hirschia maritima TaxID=1121961 RepID=UPI0003601636|nr:cystathionine beta-lyase [Hirschia maritima]